MHINKSMAMVVAAGVLAAVPHELYSQDQTNEVWRPSPGKLQVLEQKAKDRDVLAEKNRALEKEVKTLKGTLEDTNSQLGEFVVKDGTSRLQDLERRAIGYAAMQSALKQKDELIEDLNQQLESHRQVEQELRDEIDRLKLENGEWQAKLKDAERSQKSLQVTLEQFWLGNYEYYQVRTGDTVSAIAALPLFYNDASKDVWIRQANQRQVKDIDALIPGEVLIIPRFPPSGRYDF